MTAAKIVNEFVVMTTRGTVIAETSSISAATVACDEWNCGGDHGPRSDDERRASVFRWVDGRLQAVGWS